MRDSFDRRVLPDPFLEFVRRCQAVADCRLGGGAALAGAWLGHRRSRDIDLFTHDREQLRALSAALPELGAALGGTVRLVRDGGDHVRFTAELPSEQREVDLVYDPLPTIGELPEPLEGIALLPLEDLRASKLTCLIARAEPRDLVDVQFLERAGFRPEEDLPLALQKDAGIDPAVLAWLLSEFPVEPLPDMLTELDSEQLAAYRDELSDRMRRQAAPAS
jgi:hypothetical protein